MTRSKDFVSGTRVPLRLRMVDDPQPGGLYGRWWPQSRDLAVELADLVDHFPSVRGGVMRATFSPPDWDTSLRRVRVKRGDMKAGSFPRDDTHMMLLTMFDRTTLKILVIPPGGSPEEGEAALRTGSPGDYAPVASPTEPGITITHRSAGEGAAVGGGSEAPRRGNG